jgi:hypothetical protein
MADVVGSRAKLRIAPVVAFEMEVGPIDPAATLYRLAAQATAAGAALTGYLTDRAATKAGYDLVPGP